MKPPVRPLFLERQTYRGRRIMDAARLLPILGLFLFMMPLLRQTGGPAATAGIVVYIFAVWFVLIILAGLLSRRLHRANGALVEDGQEDDG